MLREHLRVRRPAAVARRRSPSGCSTTAPGPRSQELAERHGFVYRTRPNRGELKKAGNLRFGYEQSHGDLILILDADFVPRHDMLTELAPYFDEPDVGIVQSPQFFDTHAKGMNWLQRCAGATQELFYRLIQPSRDRASAAICVGTCAVYRRAALQKAGGFAQIGHSEDVHTGVKLAKVGLRLRYVPVLVSKGLCPDTPAGLPQPAVPLVHRQHVAAGRPATSTRRPASDQAPAALLLGGLPLLHLHGRERGRGAAAGHRHAVAAAALGRADELDLAGRCAAAVVRGAARW